MTTYPLPAQCFANAQLGHAKIGELDPTVIRIIVLQLGEFDPTVIT